MDTYGGELTANDKIALCAKGESVLQAALYEALGATWLVENGIAGAAGANPHRFLFGGVTLTPDADPDRAADIDGDICDSFSAFTTNILSSRKPSSGNVWMFRAPEEVPSCDLRISAFGIEIVSSDEELDRWENVSFLANGTARATSGELHPPGSQRDRRLTFLSALVHGETIGTALAVRGTETVTVSAVTVMPDWRGRGIGGALTAQAIRTAPELPAVLAASDLGLGVYSRLGFEGLGRFRRWARS